MLLTDEERAEREAQQERLRQDMQRMIASWEYRSTPPAPAPSWQVPTEPVEIGGVQFVDLTPVQDGEPEPAADEADIVYIPLSNFARWGS